MQARINRRTSFGSTSSLRRSSVSSKDIQAIQMALQKQQRITPQILLAVLSIYPLTSFFYMYAIHMHGGRLFESLSWVLGRWPFLGHIIPPLTDSVAWKCTLVITSLQIIFHSVLPHDEVIVLSPTGDVKRQVNSFSSLLLLMLLYMLGVGLRLYPPDVIVVHFNSIVVCMAILSLVIYAAMYVHYRLGDNYMITTISEFCFGVELTPVVLDIDLKNFVRFGLGYSLWALFALSAVLQQFNNSGKVSTSLLCLTSLQLLYIFRKTWQEQLELNSLDSTTFNLGILRLWTDMVWIPIMCTSPNVVILHATKRLSLLPCILFSILGIIAIFMTQAIDSQKYEFRRAKGNLKIRGVDAFFITAKYKTETGDTHANLLLGSGYWGYVRHPNYLTEMVTFLSFCLLQGRSPVYSYFPFFFVTGYLIMRMLSDESRCLVKYGQYWIQHSCRVPFRLIPGVY